ncbi:MAG: 3,4-dihydroxy-2-butanone-4-phosphate synthase [Flammeovirgaceae bacterium]|nr:3,4-dihydroxy-2-butanone-4-phosphate synthase [Flammeovirgaceae bacterium]
MGEIKLNTIEEAVDSIRKGEIIIVVDDEDRENEGDFICAAELVTPEIINFMAKEGRGLICTPITEDRCRELDLELMVGKNTATHETPFTVSVDLIGHGCTTGISASDRSKTIRALVDPNTNPAELGRPGHIFPLKAKKGGVLRRTGHTEAAIDFARLAGLKPAGVLVEIMNEDGTMARLPDLRKVANKFDLKLVTIKDLIEYRLNHESLIKEEIDLPFPSVYGDFELHAFKDANTDNIHLAFCKGEWDKDEPVLVRVHTSNLLDDLLGFKPNKRGGILHKGLGQIEKEGKGLLLYMNNSSDKYEGLLDKLTLLKENSDISQSNAQLKAKMDDKDYGLGAQILRKLGVSKMKLISNSPQNRVGLIGYGLEIVEIIPFIKER